MAYEKALAALADPLPAAGDEILRVGFDIGFGLHLLDIGSGGEGALVAGEDDGADRRIEFELIKRRAFFGYGPPDAY